MWAYAYEIVPPQATDRLHMIKTLLDRERSEAQRGARIWAGRFVTEEQVTHILVVSDSPDQAGEVNRSIEAELTALRAEFSVTAPMSVADGDAPDGPGAVEPPSEAES